MTVDPQIIPDQVSNNPQMFYYVLDLQNGGARIFYTRDNSDGKLLTEDFEFAYKKICLDKTEKTVDPTLMETVFNNYKHVTFYEDCQDLINNYLHNKQYIKGIKYKFFNF